MDSINARQKASTVSTPSPALTPQMMFENLKKQDSNAIKNIQAALKNAGHQVAVNGKVTPKFFTTYWKVYNDARGYTLGTGQQWDDSGAAFAAYLEQEKLDRMGSGSGGASTRISDPTSAKALINAVFEDQLGRTASNDEVKKYTAMIQKAQRNNPTYTSGGVTTGGINEQQFLIDQVTDSDEATQNRALSAFDTLAKLLGGGS